MRRIRRSGRARRAGVALRSTWRVTGRSGPLPPPPPPPVPVLLTGFNGDLLLGPDGQSLTGV